MFVDFDKVFHQTEEQKREHAKLVNNLLCESLKNNGECCCNCKYNMPSHIGLDIMLPRCMKKKKLIEEDERCVYYEFCGFIEMP
jgi:hypothetical protein